MSPQSLCTTIPEAKGRHQKQYCVMTGLTLNHGQSLVKMLQMCLSTAGCSLIVGSCIELFLVFLCLLFSTSESSSWGSKCTMLRTNIRFAALDILRRGRKSSLGYACAEEFPELWITIEAREAKSAVGPVIAFGSVSDTSRQTVCDRSLSST